MQHELPSTLKVATIWILVALALFFGIQAWQHQARQTRFVAGDGVIEIRRAEDGHYHWPGEINGRRVTFLIDTGATGTAISTALAAELGLKSEGEATSMTANGPARGQLMRADVALEGGVRAERLRITALPGLGPQPLLGMNVLGKLRWQQREGVLRIEMGER
ncbi:retroviral-like aspartic protease family protein [Aquincola sp. S2]|uniref:Retroviral-like aspartic protease family protein n=1 Tax=Pseudaquabacterium terrae TaxID=2732868 RepID=A0ABX2EER9_9BURK|nr:retropepsin-like aspartic protease [Aquabacterium terrae]NRF67127.1 retroviral-like aspartic protease family protein [Aquabacterium terrae]